MKSILLLILVACLFSCKKIKNNPVYQISLTESAAGIGLKFNTPYKMEFHQNGTITIDTIVFHYNANGSAYNDTITEIYMGVTNTYICDYVLPVINNGKNINLDLATGDTLKNQCYLYPENCRNISGSIVFPKVRGGYISLFTSGDICQNKTPTLGIRFSEGYYAILTKQ